jgi:hypothetical protein
MLFSPPKEWQDWGSLLLGIWLCVSPWAIFTLSALGIFEELIDVVLGAWLLVSVWLFGISTPTARVDLIVSGLAVLIFSFYEIWDSRRTPTTRA